MSDQRPLTLESLRKIIADAKLPESATRHFGTGFAPLEYEIIEVPCLPADTCYLVDGESGPFITLGTGRVEPKRKPRRRIFVSRFFDGRSRKRRALVKAEIARAVELRRKVAERLVAERLKARRAAMTRPRFDYVYFTGVAWWQNILAGVA